MPEERSKRHRSKHRRGRSRNVEEGSHRAYSSGILDKIPISVIYGICFVMAVFGFTFLVVGSVHMHDCNIEKLIPIWILIMGIHLMLSSLWLVLQGRSRKNSTAYKSTLYQSLISIFLYIFFLIWFIVGNVWIYKSWGDGPDYGHYWFENACDKSLFILSLCAIIAFDVFVALMAVGLCCWLMSQFVVKE